MGGSAAWRARRHRGLFWSAVALCLAALVAGSVVAYTAYVATSGPDGAVREYFAALQHGNAAAALGFGDVPAGDHALLTRDVLREQQKIAPIQAVRVAVASRASDRATVSVHYQLGFANGQQEITDTATVLRRGRSWRLAASAVAVQLHLLQASDRASIIGGPVPADPVLMFPGAIPIRFDSAYLQLSRATSSVPLTGPALTDVAVDITPQGRQAALTALAAALRPCLVGAPSADPRCPMPSQRAVPDSLHGTLVGGLGAGTSVTVGADASGVLDISATPRVRGSYQLLDFNNIAVTQSGTVSVPVRASAYAVAPLRVQWLAP
ncbi:MAG: hypothetical protein M3N95_14435 [Actinomycetota bacterium]|nr:hypothetical protein [Actinomycetota bacterium]